MRADLDGLLTTAKGDDQIMVQVLRVAKNFTGKSYTLGRALGDRTVFTLNSIRKCVMAYMQMRIYRCGDLFATQLSGVPIGGPLSSSILRLVLGAREHTFDQLDWFQIATGLRIQGQRKEWISACRYEDDILLVSFAFCPPMY